jgi:uncharacterized protein with beta-barrel porin domain
MLQQIIADRLDGTARGTSAGAHFAGFDAWLRPLGGGLAQSGGDGTPGYSASTGGVAVGLDRSVSAGLSLGSTFAYSRSNASGNTVDAPGSLAIDSYVLGLYGSLALTPSIGLDMQLSGGLNDNSASRTISFLGSTRLYGGGRPAAEAEHRPLADPRRDAGAHRNLSPCRRRRLHRDRRRGAQSAGGLPDL